jgi:polycystin 2
LSVPRNYLIRIDEGFKADSEISQSIGGKASVLAAIEAQRSRTLGRDLIIHVCFFGIFVAILFMQRAVSTSYNINSSIATALITQQIDASLQPFPKTYLDVGQWDEFRDYLMGCFVPGVTAMEDYSGRNLSSYELWNVQYVNQVVGSIRFRQMRVKNDSCGLTGQFKGVANACYSEFYDSSSKETEPFGPAYNRTKYQYTKDSGGVELYGHIRGFWDASGYVVDIPMNENFSAAVQELIDDDWWGAPTRAILISVILISPNFNSRATVLYLLSEFTAGGQVKPYVVSRTFRVSMYSGSSVDNFRAFLEIVFLLFVTHYILELIRGLIVHVRLGRTKQFCTDLWNIIELINLAIFFASIVMYLKYLTSNRTNVDLAQKDYIVRLEHMGEDAIQFYQLSAINILLSALKTFKYLQLSPRLYVLWETMYEARLDMATYMVMFLIILLGFLFFGWLTFGPDLWEFNGFINSLGTLWQFLIGNPPDYGELSLSNRVLGPVYYALFTVFVFFILVNMFVAIVSNSYEQVTNRTERKPITTYQVKKPFKRVMKLAKAVYKRKPLYSETELLRMLQHKEILEKDVVTKQEIEQELKDLGEDPLSLYIERLLSIHEKRKKFLAELALSESEKKKEQLEDEYDRRVEHGESLSSINFRMQEVDMEILAESNSVMVSNNVNNIIANNNNNNVNSHENNNNTSAHGASSSETHQLTQRMDLLEAKLDLILNKLEALTK